MVEDGAAIHKLPVVFSHCSSSRLGVEEPIVAMLTQLREEAGIVLVRLHLLERRARKDEEKMEREEGRDGETKRTRRGTCKIRKEMHRRRDRRGKEESDRVRGMEVNM